MDRLLRERQLERDTRAYNAEEDDGRIEAGAKSKGAEYDKLCASVLNGPLSANLQLRPVRDGATEVHNFLSNILQSNSKFDGLVRSTIEERMQDAHLLLDNRVKQGNSTKSGRKHARRNSRSNRSFSLHQHRLIGSYDLPKDARRYNAFKDLQEMWIAYAENLLATCRSNEAIMHSRLLTADLHGADLAVVDSKNSTFSGMQGIMVMETAKTFGLITLNDKFIVVPKEGSTFRLKLKNLMITLFGSSLGQRDGAS